MDQSKKVPSIDILYNRFKASELFSEEVIPYFIEGAKACDKFISIEELKPNWFQPELVKFEFRDSDNQRYTRVLLAWRAWSETLEKEVYTIEGTNTIVNGEPIEWKPVYNFR